MVTPFLCSAADLQLIPAERVPNAALNAARRNPDDHETGVIALRPSLGKFLFMRLAALAAFVIVFIFHRADLPKFVMQLFIFVIHWPHDHFSVIHSSL